MRNRFFYQKFVHEVIYPKLEFYENRTTGFFFNGVRNSAKRQIYPFFQISHGLVVLDTFL